MQDDLNALEDGEFRARVRAFLDEEYPGELRNPPKRLHFRESRPWYMALSRKGWLAPGWPLEWGGMGLAAAKQLVMIEELERHGCARFNDMGVTMIGPLLIRFGTDAQKRFFLPKILAGEHIWCQGYSEPNAGSDLASLRTEAVLEGEHWVVNGQKIWTTLANDANWIFLLVRTDKKAKPQEGISFLLVPMETPGITVRPIINLDLHDEFCEVFFDNVRVPRESGRRGQPRLEHGQGALGLRAAAARLAQAGGVRALAAEVAGGTDGRVGGSAVPRPLHAASARSRGP